MKIDKTISRRQFIGAMGVGAAAAIVKICSNENPNYYPSPEDTLNSLAGFLVIKYVGKNGNVNCVLIAKRGSSQNYFCHKIDLENECLKREGKLGYWTDVENSFDIIDYDTLPRVLTRKYDYKESYTIKEIKDAVEDYKLEEVKPKQKKWFFVK